MINYLLDNRLLHAKQYGFIIIKGRSTSLQLLHIMDKWTEYLEQGGQIDVMYSDFEKAFDKVSHDRLIYKLKLYGFSNDIITWIQDFLKDRKFRVRVNASYSTWDDVTSGLPQGSVLAWAAPEGWQGGQLPPCALALAPPVAPPGKMLVLLKCPVVVKGVLQQTCFISINERLMYKFYKNCNYFIFK